MGSSVILEEGDFPRETIVRTHIGTLRFARYDDGSLNIYAYNDHGKLFTDFAVNQHQATLLENLFEGVAPRSFRATKIRLVEAWNNAPDDEDES